MAGRGFRHPRFRVSILLISVLVTGNSSDDQTCQLHAPPQIIGHWERAISTYDAIGSMMYLEFDVHFHAGTADSCTGTHEAVVELDGRVVAKTQDTEAGVLIEGVELGRHWLIIRVVDAQGREQARQMVEFVLQFHYQLVITEPPNRSQLRRKPDSPDLRICFKLTPPANCTDDQCAQPTSPALRLTVDGVDAGKHIQIEDPEAWSMGFGKGCGVIEDFFALPSGRHSLAVELLDAFGMPLGPISYLHHVTLLDDSEPSSAVPRGYSWIQSKGEPSAVLNAAWDVVIDAGGLAEGSDGQGHGVFINPCLYRIAGAGKEAWGVLFREHELKGAGHQGYRMRLDPSRQWDGRLLWDGMDAGAPLESGVSGARIDVGCSAPMRIDMGHPPSLEGAQGPQDARLVVVGARRLLWFNGNSRALPSRVTQHFLPLPPPRLCDAAAPLPAPSEVRVSQAVFEKNFVAFDYQGDLLFAYSVEPHVVYRLDEASGAAQVLHSSSNRLLSEAISSGSMWLHGGAVAIKVQRRGRAEYLSVCHTKEPDRERYLSFAYTFQSTPPFRVLAWSRALGLQGKIQMAMGVAVVGEEAESGDESEDGRELMVSYGSEDRSMRIAFFPLAAVLGSLEDVAEPA